MNATHEDQALLLEALSDKVLHQLPAAVWKELFLGSGRDSIRFEQRQLALVHAESAVPAGQAGSMTVGFYQELQRISARHGGRLDPYVDAAALATFEDPGAAVRMAMDLQRAAAGIALRVGVVSGSCTLAFFRAYGRLWCTPLGPQPARAAQAAARAAVGGILISPENLGAGDIRRFQRGFAPVQADFIDSEPDLASLAYDAEYEGIDIRC